MLSLTFALVIPAHTASLSNSHGILFYFDIEPKKNEENTFKLQTWVDNIIKLGFLGIYTRTGSCREVNRKKHKIMKVIVFRGFWELGGLVQSENDTVLWVLMCGLLKRNWGISGKQKIYMEQITHADNDEKPKILFLYSKEKKL